MSKRDYNPEEYCAWVSNEYSLWDAALTECLSEETFENFRKEYRVERMLEMQELYSEPFILKTRDLIVPWRKIEAIDNIGNPNNKIDIKIKVNEFKISCTFLRYVYYANKILNTLKDNKDIRIVEIGGGYGGFCAIMHLLARFRNITIAKYDIYDLSEAQKLQRKYLGITMAKSPFGIQNIAFLDSNNIEGYNCQHNFCISFYALGEFATPIKNKYIDSVVSKTEHGFILWNPYEEDKEGENLLKQYHPNLQITEEDPLTGPNNLEIIF